MNYNVEIFRVMSSRLLSKYPEKENELLDEIIKNLNNYLELTTTSNGWKIIAYNVKSISELRLCEKKHSEQFINAMLAEVALNKKILWDFKEKNLENK